MVGSVARQSARALCAPSCIFTVGAVVFPRCSLDAAHLARVPAHLLPPESPAADPGSAQRLQLHPGGGVHGGADHARPAAHVPDPPLQQGPSDR